ncbi:hypothetical protein, partial [Streptomyces sp. NPDC002265]|uniref:hypothetical protein n=1 Tax=Streptomyces sp. NPDC002265 TaxID=3154415 RepID=UPI00332958CC
MGTRTTQAKERAPWLLPVERADHDGDQEHGHGAFPREGGHAVIDHAASVSLAVWCRRSYSLGL